MGFKFCGVLSGTKPYRLIDENEVEKLRRENEELRRRVEALSKVESDVAYLMKELRELKAEREKGSS